MGGAREGGDALDLEGKRALAAVLAGIGKKPVEKLRVGRYEIGDSIGSGGCGQVFAARDPKLDREVAIKVVSAGRDRDGRTADRAAEARLVREGQALARLQHPNTVKIYDVGIDEIGASLGGGARRGVYIVMERIRGRTLSQWLRDTVPSPAEIVRAYLDAARGLAAAHAVGVVHRDFKPGNAMVTREGTVVVLDFGLATALDEWATQDTDAEIVSASASVSGSGAASRSSSSAASLTATGVVMGTPRYMAPEQHSARPATPATDQYAWSVALWEALTGVPPFVASSIEGLAQVKRTAKLPAAPRIPPHIRAALARGLAADPARRFDSMTALIAAIERGSGRRRVRNVVLLGTLAAAAVAAAFALPPTSPPLCDRDDDPAQRSWSNAHNDELIAELSARADPPLPMLVERIDKRLDRFALRWDATHASVCGPEGEALEPATRRTQAECLERAELRFHEARSALVEGSPEHLPWLSQLWALQNPSRCATPTADDAFSEAASNDPELRDVRAFVEASLFGEGPNSQPAAEDLDRAIEVADRFGDHALAANALTLRARAHSQTQEFGDATRTASLAAWRARGGDDTLLAAEILPESIFMSVIRGAPPNEIDAMLASARELESAPDAPLDLRAHLDNTEAFALEFRGDLDAALAKYLSNWASLEAEPIPSSPHLLMQALEGAASLHLRRGEHWAALVMYDRVIDSIVAQDDDDRGMFVADTRSRQAEAALFTGDLDTAAIASAEALQGFSTYGGTPEHVAMELGQYGYILGIRGQLDEGKALIEEGLKRLRELDRAPMMPQLQHQLAHLHELADEPARAVELVQQLRGVLIDHGMSRPGHEASTWAWIASLKARAGDLDGSSSALSQAEKDVTAMKAARDSGSPDSSARKIPEELVARARAELAAARGDWPTVRESLSEVLADPSLHDGTALSQGELGIVYWLYARALAHTGDRKAAIEVATLADEALTTADPLRKTKRPTLTQWRKTLGPPR